MTKHFIFFALKIFPLSSLKIFLGLFPSKFSFPLSSPKIFPKFRSQIFGRSKPFFSLARAHLTPCSPSPLLHPQSYKQIPYWPTRSATHLFSLSKSLKTLIFHSLSKIRSKILRSPETLESGRQLGLRNKIHFHIYDPNSNSVPPK